MAQLYNGLAHALWGETVARFIGWADSPFQFEVAMASLGFAVNGIIAFRVESPDGAVVAPAVFLLGAALGHIRQMIGQHNFASGNAGSGLWTDTLVPLLGLALLRLRYGRETS